MAFDNKLIRTTCENEECAKEQYGNEISQKLKARLADFRAFKNVSELIAGNPQELPHSFYKVDLLDEYMIIFSANHVDIPLLDNDGIAWNKVTRIKILKIDKHG